MSPRLVSIIALLALGGTSFGVIFHQYLKEVPAASYEARDDAVVTLSHARNLVEYGFIGVSPSGERVEGFSAPLQFWIATLIYLVTPFEYATFLHWQTEIGIVVLGMIFAGLLIFPIPGNDRASRCSYVAFALLAIPLILATSRTFLLWHASGMENVYKVSALLAVVWAVDSMLHSGRLDLRLSAVVFAATLTRIDAILPVGVLLVTFGALWWRKYRSFAPVRFIAASLVPWLLMMAWRLWYFGQWEPNTAVAQDISASSRLGALFTTPSKTLAEHADWLLLAGNSLQGFQFAWLPLVLLLARGHRAALDRATLLVAGGTACVLQYTFFGPARMDAVRTVTELGVYSTALVPFVLLGRTTFRPVHLVTGMALLGISASIAISRPLNRTEVGWGTTFFEANANTFERLAQEQDLPRPLVANPDLGAVSWRKRFNMFDLGMLGSAVVPRFDDPVRFLVESAKPDIVEIHDIWSCRYNGLFTSSQFLDEYTPIAATRTEWLEANCRVAPAARSGIWMRRAVMKGSAAPERRFIDTFRTALDVNTTERELAACAAESETPQDCGYVGRTLFRFVPELKQRGAYDAIAALLARDPQLAIAHATYVSSTDATWWRDVVTRFHPVSAEPSRLSVFALADATRTSHATVALRDRYRVGWRVESSAPDLLTVAPSTGIGSTTLRLVANKTHGEIDRLVEVPVYERTSTIPAMTLTVRFRSMLSIPESAPFGSVDAPPDPVALGSGPVTFAGWALDVFDMQRVRVVVVDDQGRVRSIGDALRGGFRPDVAAVHPDGHDIYNAAWTFTLDPQSLPVRPRRVALRFYAEAGDGRLAEIGTRTIR